MHEISCPHCSKAFHIDESGYAEILNQVRDEAFDKALHERLALAEQDKKAAIELAETKAFAEAMSDAAKKDAEIERLNQEVKTAAELAVAKTSEQLKGESVKKDTEIARLSAELDKASGSSPRSWWMKGPPRDPVVAL